MSNMKDKYTKRYDEMKDTLEELPYMMTVYRNNAEISDAFWHALSNRVRSADDPEWRAFLEETKDKLRHVFDTTAVQQRDFSR